MTEYYVSGCIEIDGTVGRETDEDAEFFTLYEKDDQGLSQCIADFTDRLSAEAAMQVYQERDALQQQVNALAEENLVMLRLLNDISESHEECTHDDQMYALIPLEYVSEINGHVARDVEGENPFAATDAIKRQWMAEGAKEVAQYHFVRIDALKEVSRQGYLFHKAAYFDAKSVAAQLRQQEEKG